MDGFQFRVLELVFRWVRRRGHAVRAVVGVELIIDCGCPGAASPARAFGRAAGVLPPRDRAGRWAAGRPDGRAPRPGPQRRCVPGPAVFLPLAVASPQEDEAHRGNQAWQLLLTSCGRSGRPRRCATFRLKCDLTTGASEASSSWMRSVSTGTNPTGDHGRVCK